jgi:hypothetical protein
MISKYRGNRQAISALVRETEVHRDLYLDQELFELEMEHLFANTWIYVGHDSQVPKVGDYYATTIGAQPVLMVRDSESSSKFCTTVACTGPWLTGETCGNRSLLPLPLPCLDLPPRRQLRVPEDGYDGTGFPTVTPRAHDAGAARTITAASSSPS